MSTRTIAPLPTRPRRWSIMGVRTYTRGSGSLDLALLIVGLIMAVAFPLLAKMVLPQFMVKHKMV